MYLAFRLVHFDELQQRFYRLDLAWIVAAQTALLVPIVLAAARWQIIAKRCGIELTMLRSLRFTLIGAFFSQTLPSTIGGDAARMWFLARTAGHSKPAVYSVLMDRAVGLIWLAAFVLVCLPWSMRLIENPVGRATLVLIGVGGVAGPLVLLARTQAGRKTLIRWRVTRHLTEILAVAWTTLTSRRAGGLIAAMSIAIHLMIVLAAWLAARAIGSPLGHSEPPQLDAVRLPNPIELRLNVEHRALASLEKPGDQRPSAAHIILTRDRKDDGIGRPKPSNELSVMPYSCMASSAETSGSCICTCTPALPSARAIIDET